MPYIKKGDGRREALQKFAPALSAGELNYQIFYYVKHNCSKGIQYNDVQNIEAFVNMFLGMTPNYQKYNDITGALIRCQREIERRLEIDASWLEDIMKSYDKTINEYEDKKIEENGDVE